jgi:hypothetical protein
MPKACVPNSGEHALTCNVHGAAWQAERIHSLERALEPLRSQVARRPCFATGPGCTPPNREHAAPRPPDSAPVPGTGRLRGVSRRRFRVQRNVCPALPATAAPGARRAAGQHGSMAAWQHGTRAALSAARLGGCREVQELSEALLEMEREVDARVHPRPLPPPRTKWTRRVPHPVLSGHAATLTPY